MAAPRMMILIFGLLALVVGAVAALALDSWWILVVVMAVHALGSALVVGYAWLQASKTGDKPDPVTEARVEEAVKEADGAAVPGTSRVTRDREVFE
jgi:membrane protein implicated in regulation of membrane protease activity